MKYMKFCLTHRLSEAISQKKKRTLKVVGEHLLSMQKILNLILRISKKTAKIPDQNYWQSTITLFIKKYR